MNNTINRFELSSERYGASAAEPKPVPAFVDQDTFQLGVVSGGGAIAIDHPGLSPLEKEGVSENLSLFLSVVARGVDLSSMNPSLDVNPQEIVRACLVQAEGILRGISTLSPSK